MHQRDLGLFANDGSGDECGAARAAAGNSGGERGGGG